MATPSQIPWELPPELGEELESYVAQATSLVDSHGRRRSLLNYVATLIDRRPNQSHARAFGGSRSKLYEASRKLLVRSPWPTAAVSEGLLECIERLMRDVSLRNPVVAVHVFGLRRSVNDDEPRFNYVVPAIALRDRITRDRYDFPLGGILAPTSEYLEPWEIGETQVHALEHLAPRLAFHRVLPFAAMRVDTRAALELYGWQYIQAITSSVSKRNSITFHRPNEPVRTVYDLAGLVKPENYYSAEHRVVAFQGQLGFNGSVPDWDETVVAHPHVATAHAPISWFVVNREVDERALDLIRTATRESYLEGYMDLAGAGLYRGPTAAAFVRHLSLVDIAVSFLTDRAARGCEWGRWRLFAASGRYMDRFLRETAAQGLTLETGQSRHARLIRDRALEHFPELRPPKRSRS